MPDKWVAWHDLGLVRVPSATGKEDVNLFNQEETEDADETTAPTAEKSDIEPEPPSDPPSNVAA